MTTPNTETGQTGRVSEADVLRFGLDRNAAHAERLAKENRELKEELDTVHAHEVVLLDKICKLTVALMLAKDWMGDGNGKSMNPVCFKDDLMFVEQALGNHGKK